MESLINFVQDRPGHDIRYGINSTKIRSHLGWKPIETLKTGISKTVIWYTENQKWLKNFQIS